MGRSTASASARRTERASPRDGVAGMETAGQGGPRPRYKRIGSPVVLCYKFCQPIAAPDPDPATFPIPTEERGGNKLFMKFAVRSGKMLATRGNANDQEEAGCILA